MFWAVWQWTKICYMMITSTIFCSEKKIENFQTPTNSMTICCCICTMYIVQHVRHIVCVTKMSRYEISLNLPFTSTYIKYHLCRPFLFFFLFFNIISLYRPLNYINAILSCILWTLYIFYYLTLLFYIILTHIHTAHIYV